MEVISKLATLLLVHLLTETSQFKLCNLTVKSTVLKIKVSIPISVSKM